MKIAVVGTARGRFTEDTLKKAYSIGMEIAKKKATLLSGGCRGYPYMASLGAKAAGGKTKAFSPAKNKKEHKEVYDFPSEFTQIVYTGKGIPERNMCIVDEADKVVIISGKIGTLNEFTLAYHHGIDIGVLKGSGGITGILPGIEKACRRPGYSRIVYDSDPRKLVRRLIG